MRLREPGTYLAQVEQAAVTETKSGLAQWEASFRCTHVWDEATKDWAEVEGHENEIKGWFVLEKKDFQLNDFQIKQCIQALGWDGASFDSLNQMNEFPVVQIAVQNEKGLDGNWRLRIAFLNHKDRRVGPRAAKPIETSAMSKLDARHKAKLAELKGKIDDIPEDEIPF